MKKILSFLFLVSSLFMDLKVRAQDISTIAGTGIQGYTGDGGLADTAEITVPYGVAADNKGNVYFADNTHNTVRKISSTGIITTVAGIDNTIGGYNGDSIAANTALLNGPIGVAVDAAGNLYIGDNSNFRVRMVDTNGIITTVAGIGGTYGFGHSGDSGLATLAHIYVTGIAVDDNQNLYIADGLSYIRKVTHATGIITTIAGTSSVGYSGDSGPATAAALNNPVGVAVGPGGYIFIADYSNNVIRMVDNAATPIIHTIAGTGVAGYSGDGGPAINAKLSGPYAVAVDDSLNLYIGEINSCRVRKVNTLASSPTITTFAGDGVCGYNGDGIPATTAKINIPAGLATDDSGNVYISDQNNNRIRKVSHAPVVVPTGVHAPVLQTTAHVYPNPVSESLNIENVQPNTGYRLLNVTGNTMLQGILTQGSNTIPVQSIAQGVYMLEMTGADGSKNIVRVVKE